MLSNQFAVQAPMARILLNDRAIHWLVFYRRKKWWLGSLWLPILPQWMLPPVLVCPGPFRRSESWSPTANVEHNSINKIYWIYSTESIYAHVHLYASSIITRLALRMYTSKHCEKQYGKYLLMISIQLIDAVQLMARQILGDIAIHDYLIVGIHDICILRSVRGKAFCDRSHIRFSCW